MWKCPSKRKLDGKCALFSTPRCNRGLWLVHVARKTRQAGSRVGLRLFQLPWISFNQVLLDHFCRGVRELLHVGIAPAFCFLFEFSQIFFVILHHGLMVLLCYDPEIFCSYELSTRRATSR